MKQLLLTAAFLALCMSITLAQALNPVSWTFTVEAAGPDGTYALVATAQLEEQWALYSQHTDPDGPIPTEFTIDQDQVILVEGMQELSEPIVKYSDLFEVETIKFKKEATFKQVFKTDQAKAIEGTVRYMTCDDTRCLPPKEVAFSATIPPLNE